MAVRNLCAPWLLQTPVYQGC